MTCNTKQKCQLVVFAHRELKNVSPKRQEVIEDIKNCIVRRFIICTFAECYVED